MILASIIQGSSSGPVYYVVPASSLHPVTPDNCTVKFVNDTYLIVSADNVQSCADEIAQFESWAAEDNLTLNQIKSVEIVFISPWSKRGVDIPPPAVPGFARAESIRALVSLSAADFPSQSM